jgi:hypothetical protein
MLTDSGQAYRITTTLDSAKDGRSITVEDVKAKTKVVSTGAIGKRDFYSTFTTAVSLYNMEDPENPVKIPITSGTLTSSYESLTITITYLDGSQVITQDLEDDEFMVTKKNAAGETVSKITYHANGTYTIEGFELSLAAKSSSVYSGSGILSFDSNDDPINLQSLSIGESVLSTEDYSVESSNDTDGGMTITIDASVLSSLSNGSYTLTLTTVNGSADCDFTVSKISYHYTKPTTETPKDADGDTDTPTVDWEKKIKDGVENTTISAKSKVTSGSITVFWTKSKGYKVDGYQIFRSTKKSGGYKKFFTTTKNSYKNTKTLTSGKRYYYKVRGYRSVNGKKVYTQWSNIVSRKAI